MSGRFDFTSGSGAKADISEKTVDPSGRIGGFLSAMALSLPYLPPLRPRVFRVKGAEGMKKLIPNNRSISQLFQTVVAVSSLARFAGVAGNRAAAICFTLLFLAARTASRLLWFVHPHLTGKMRSPDGWNQRQRPIVASHRTDRVWKSIGAIAFASLAFLSLSGIPAQAQTSAQSPAPPPAAPQPSAPETTSLVVLVVDKENQPVPHAKVFIQSADDNREHVRFAQAGQDGKVLIKDLPPNVTVFVYANEGERSSAEFPRITLGKVPSVTVKLGSANTIVVHAFVSGTKETVPKPSIFLGTSHPQGMLRWNHAGTTKDLGNGRIVVTVSEHYFNNGTPRLRLDAKGYAQWISEPLVLVDGRAKVEAALEPETGLKGIVTDDNGAPVSGALVWVEDGSTQAPEKVSSMWIDEIAQGKSSTNRVPENHAVSDVDGVFVLKQVHPLLSRSTGLYALHPDGVSRARISDFKSGEKLTLSRLCTVRGKFTRGGKPVAEQKVFLNATCGIHTEVNFSTTLRQDLDATTDKNGQFEFRDVFPESEVELRIKGVTTALKKFDLGSGVAVQQDIDLESEVAGAKKTPRSLVGALKLPNGVTTDWKNLFVRVEPFGADFDTDYDAEIAADGSFVVSNVVPGFYSVSAFLHLPNPNSRSGGTIYYEGSVDLQLKEDAGKDFNLGALVLGEAGASSPDAVAPPASAHPKVQIKTLDEADKPVAGATVQARILRFASAPARGIPLTRVLDYGISPTPVPDLLTDGEGLATVSFPRDVPYHPPIGLIGVRVSKPGFVSQTIDYLEEDVEPTVILKRSAGLRIRATYNGKAVPPEKLTANVAFDVTLPMKAEGEWLISHDLPDYERTVLVTARMADDDWLFSDQLDLKLEPGETSEITCELKPAVKLHGRIQQADGKAVGKGWVIAYVNVWLPYVNNLRRKSVVNWTAWTQVKPDGTYSFAGLPPGSLKLVANGPDWISYQSGNGGLFREAWISRKQPDQQWDLLAVPTQHQKIRIVADDGTAVEGARVIASGMSRPSCWFLWDRKEEDRHVRDSERAIWQQHIAKPLPGLEAITDAKGNAELLNLPAGEVKLIIEWSQPGTNIRHSRVQRVTVDPQHHDPVEIRLPAESASTSSDL